MTALLRTTTPLLALGLSLCLGLGCPAPQDAADPPPDPISWAVSEPGPYSVGYRTWESTYIPPGSTEQRSIVIHLWYPTLDESGETATYEFMFPDEQSLVGATPEAPVHAEGYPVLAYSHGNQGFAGASAYLMRHFASHGWLAVAPDHTGNTLSTHQSPRPLSLWLDRPSDIAHALDQLEAGNSDDGHPAALPGLAHTSQVTVAGHSFGAYTVWAAVGARFDRTQIQAQCDAGSYTQEQCSDDLLDAFEVSAGDPRLVGGLPMAGSGREEWFGATGLNAVSLPMLQMSGSLDAGAVDGTWERADQVDMTWIDIEGGCHQLFGLGTCPEVPSDEGFSIVNTYALAFARNLVLQDSTETTLAILDGSELVSERVTFQRR
ncbi:MAG: hypothetical protein CL928_13230 [Deltaproteobacteria bacterium]|nr:hypothetical protein [Deltaproteobacteria bacterium]